MILYSVSGFTETDDFLAVFQPRLSQPKKREMRAMDEDDLKAVRIAPFLRSQGHPSGVVMTIGSIRNPGQKKSRPEGGPFIFSQPDQLLFIIIFIIFDWRDLGAKPGHRVAANLQRPSRVDCRFGSRERQV